MTAVPLYRVLADTVLVLHAGVVVFVVGGLPAIWAGNRVGLGWVNNLWFRAAHLAAILFVVAESGLGITCPLTSLEGWLRFNSGSEPYAKGFIEFWLQHALFYEAPAWVFSLAYVLFALLVMLTWWHFPPGRANCRRLGAGMRSMACAARRRQA